MSLKLNYNQCDSKDTAYEAVKTNVTPEAIAKYKVEADFDYNPGAYQITGKGKGFKLTMSFQEDHATVDLDLAFLLKPLKSKILDSLEKQMTRFL